MLAAGTPATGEQCLDLECFGFTGPAWLRRALSCRTAVSNADNGGDIVAVYLHWGIRNRGCPTQGQRELART